MACFPDQVGLRGRSHTTSLVIQLLSEPGRNPVGPEQVVQSFGNPQPHPLFKLLGTLSTAVPTQYCIQQSTLTRADPQIRSIQQGSTLEDTDAQVYLLSLTHEQVLTSAHSIPWE